MKIEVLFPEIANLYGDLANIRYLQASCPTAHVVETALSDTPIFLSEPVDLVYLGTMTERSQQLVMEKLLPLKAQIEEAIAHDVRFLFTGNALEIMGKEIRDVDGTVVRGLDIFDVTTKRDMLHRFNSLYLGGFSAGEGQRMDIVGYKSQFTHSYWNCGPEETDLPLFTTERGPGLNPEIQGEGIRRRNFMATYLIGPLLVLNPPFTRWLLHEMGEAAPSLAFEEDAMLAYHMRVEEYRNPKTGFYY